MPIPVTRRGLHRLSNVLHAALWKQWRAPVGLSFGLSVAILGLVVLMVGLGDQPASGLALAGDPATLPAAAPDHRGGGFVLLPSAGPSGGVSSAGQETGSSEPLTFTVTGRQTGPCTACSDGPSGDQLYDPEMGFFTGSLSGPLSGTIAWNRQPFVNPTFNLGPFSTPGGPFLFWLHRDKGCGDFHGGGVSSSDPTTFTTNIEPFSIECTGSLAEDTTRLSFFPISGTMQGPSACPASCPPVFYNSGSGGVSISVDNRTSTDLMGQLIVESNAAGQKEKKSEPVSMLADAAALMEFSARLNDLFVDTFLPARPQAQSIAAVTTPQVTATLVYSFGPTARISRTMVIAKPEQNFLPLTMKQQLAAW